jgi:hypothetical protein
MKKSPVLFIYEQLEGIRKDRLSNRISSEQAIRDRKFSLEEAEKMEKDNMINFLKSVFQQDNFNYEKVYNEFINNN